MLAPAVHARLGHKEADLSVTQRALSHLALLRKTLESIALTLPVDLRD